MDLRHEFEIVIALVCVQSSQEVYRVEILTSEITQPLSRNFFLDHGNAIFKDSLLTNFYGYYSTLKALTLL